MNHLSKVQSLLSCSKRSFSSTANSKADLKTVLREVIPVRQQELNDAKKKYGDKVLGNITVNQALGGMRGIKGLFYDQSTVDPIDGVLFRGYSIPELHDLLPKNRSINDPAYKRDQQPLPEGIFFLLLTGQLPSEHQVNQIREEWNDRGKVSPQLRKFINSLDNRLHPVVMLDLAILYEQQNSQFSKLYMEGKLTKNGFWEYTYEDSVDILSKLPIIMGLIYRHKFMDSKDIEPVKGLDWSAQLAHLMGHDNNKVINECLRAFLTVHSDHEGGEVTTHAAHLAGSALGDPYLCISNSYAGIAGPLHGLASQEALKWILNFVEVHGSDVSNSQIEEYVNDTITAGKLVPGYGHAVLRRPDPRFLHFYDFANKYLKDDDLIKLLHQMTDIVPRKLRSYKNISNPYPNVDAHSGALLYSLGIKEYSFYTALFAMSRTIGSLTNIIWCRAFGLPIERPESSDMIYYRQLFDPAGAAKESDRLNAIKAKEIALGRKKQ